MSSKSPRFNLVLITPDQLRADYLSCYGHPFIATGHIDALAQQAVRLGACYCSSPLCGPSRISFVTSTYVGEHGHRNYGSTISSRVPNLVTELKNAGYRTGMFGKNHCFNYGELADVWDALDEVCLGNYDGHPNFQHSFSAFELEPDHPYNITGRLTTELIDFIRSCRRDQPFLAWVNYQDPHPAFTCPAPYSGLFFPDQIVLPPTYRVGPDPTRPRRCWNWQVHSEMQLASAHDARRAVAMYCGQIRYVDDQVGRVLAALDELGLADRSVVCFFADHGELLGDHGMFHKLPVFYECLTRIPVIIRHPDGRWQPGSFPGLVEEVDLAPTLLSALDMPIPATMVGRSLDAALRRRRKTFRETVLVEAGGGAPTPPQPLPVKHRAPFAPNSFGPGAMIRRRDWKLSIYADDVCELYNLARDPHEAYNRFHDPACRDVRDALTLALVKRCLSVKVRDVGIDWPSPGPDVRFEPLE